MGDEGGVRPVKILFTLTETHTLGDMKTCDLSKFGSIRQQLLMLFICRQTYKSLTMYFYVFHHVALHSTSAFLAVCLSFFMCYLAQFLLHLQESAFIFIVNT